jgi:hypothetical protein
MSGENIKLKSNKLLHMYKYDVGHKLKYVMTLCIKTKTPLGRIRINT